MLGVLQDITSGRGQLGDVDLLRDLGDAVKAGSLCGLGQTAPNPVLTTIRYFPEEYDAHINERFCPSGTCKALFRLKIDPKRCNGCGRCLKVCPVDAVEGEKKQPHMIVGEKCITCGSCRDVCPRNSVQVHRVKN
jgi:NADP-reducing hydrogenase subunit HndC